jgi:hypothetical protein
MCVAGTLPGVSREPLRQEIAAKFVSIFQKFASTFAGGTTAQASARGPARSAGIAVGRMQSWDR